MSKRLPRINELLKKEISQLLLKEMEFPKDVLVTITRVETRPDLKEARVFVSVLPEKDIDEILKFLGKNIFFLQQKINQRLKMKFIPKILFVKELKTVEAGRIEGILEKLKKERK